MPERRRGAVYGILAYSMWGLFPLYWPLLRPAGAVEILAHRIVWSLAFTLLLMAGLRGFAALAGTRAKRGPASAPEGVGGSSRSPNEHGLRGRLGRRGLAALALAAALVSVNWGTYIWAVNSGHVVETSLGYFINPLISVMLGVLFLGERLRPGQWAAVAIAAVAVGVLTVDHGRPPWIALALAGSFGLYGFVKKKAAIAALPSLTVETALLSPPALAYLLLLEARGAGSFGHGGAVTDLLLVACGVVTAVPLLCFAAAANRVPLSTLGLLQYIAPVLQFLCGVLVFREPMPMSRWIGFALVWLGLAWFSLEAALRHRLTRSAARSSDRRGSP
jgi:chloramphenicol-sensitive protein RarD